MAEATQFTYSLQDIAKLMVKDRKITSGKWIIGFEFGVLVGNFNVPEGPNVVRPGAALCVNNVTIALAPANLPEGDTSSFVVDASEI